MKSDLFLKIIEGDVLDALKTLPDESVNLIVTSPPYWGLRSYLPEDHPDKKFEIGLEPTLDEYLDKLLKVTAELKRVLRKDGVMFWNMGDCYSNQNTILKEYSIEDDWLRLLGWIYTDGTVLRNGSRICIYQSKQKGIQEIESLLNRLGLRYSKYGPYKGNFMFYISAEDSRKINEKLGLNGRKILPEWLYFCSRRQIIILLEAIISGDGSRRKYDTAIYGTKERLEPLKELLESKDISCRLYQNKRGDWILQIHQELWNPKYIREKSLCLQNYRLAIRMIDEQGWILRNIVCWYKRNHLPSSAKDRFTSAYEPVFFFVKNKKYWSDLDAVRVPHKGDFSKPRKAKNDPKKWQNVSGQTTQKIAQHSGYYGPNGELLVSPLGKNPGDVWDIPTQPFSAKKLGIKDVDHFATFPEELVRRIIKFGCPKWICKKCGKPRVRIVQKGESMWKHTTVTNEHRPKENAGFNYSSKVNGKTINGKLYFEWKLKHPDIFVGWTDCGCNAGWRPGVVLDPFMGSGTTLKVARELGRSAIGIEINPDYVRIAKKRVNWGVGLDVEFEYVKI